MNTSENDKNDQPESNHTEPENALEKILREKFGDTKFGGLMDSIMDQMMKGMSQKDGEKKKED
jgi:hypothetical protein